MATVLEHLQTAWSQARRNPVGMAPREAMSPGSLVGFRPIRRRRRAHRHRLHRGIELEFDRFGTHMT